jgi:DNA modification methylase
VADYRILEGNAADVLQTLDAQSIQTCVTSPPYWGLRDYGDTGQLGLEPTPEQYVTNLVAVFREVRRVLRDDGTVWLNLGDSYANPGHYKGNPGNVGNIGRPQVADVEEKAAYRKTTNAAFAEAGLKN